MTGWFRPRLRGAPGDEPALFELDDVVLPDAAYGERHGEHVADGAHPLTRRRFGQVVVAIPSRLLSRVGDEFEDLVCRRRDLAARADDRGSHTLIQQHLDSDKLMGA